MSRIEPGFRVCALIGHPVGHSLSPAMHNAGFEALGLPLVYVAHDIAPGQVPEAIQAARSLGYRGLSVTIPHKVAALECMDEVDPTARAIGCINTVVNDEGRLIGYNSDGRGALNALRQTGADPEGRRVVVLGTGGAARAIAMTIALGARPAELVLLGVVPEELDRLGRDVSKHMTANVKVEPLNDATLAAAMGEADIVLHCTPIGMHPQSAHTIVPAALFRPGQVVFDVVYNPRETRLLSEAAAAGCRVVSGVEMFLGQALVQFELWTGRPAPSDVMRCVLEERL
jgi:shikimate dehydrogenase